MVRAAPMTNINKKFAGGLQARLLDGGQPCGHLRTQCRWGNWLSVVNAAGIGGVFIDHRDGAAEIKQPPLACWRTFRAVLSPLRQRLIPGLPYAARPPTSLAYPTAVWGEDDANRRRQRCERALPGYLRVFLGVARRRVGAKMAFEIPIPDGDERQLYPGYRQI